MGMKRDEKESIGQEGANDSTDSQKRLKRDDGGSSDSLKQLACCKDIPVRDALRFEVTGKLRKSSFCSFMAENSEEDVVGFFREIAREMEEKRGVLDFHLKVREQKQWFCVEVYFGDSEKKGPDEAAESGECISCFPGTALFPGHEPGVTAGECVLAEFSDPYVLCSLDAKARAGFVITPVRHVERMSQLQDDELFALWSMALRALRQEALPFRSMILNHGTYRNSPHLHLKVWVDEMLHEQSRLNWSSEKLDLWNRLLAMAKIIPPKRPCHFFQKTGKCRYGEQCRFSHTRNSSTV